MSDATSDRPIAENAAVAIAVDADMGVGVGVGAADARQAGTESAPPPQLSIGHVKQGLQQQQQEEAIQPPEAAAPPPIDAALPKSRMRKGDSAVHRAAAAAAAGDASAGPPSDAAANPVLVAVPTSENCSIAAVPAVEAAATLPPVATGPPPTHAAVPTPRIRKGDSAASRAAASAAAAAAAAATEAAVADDAPAGLPSDAAANPVLVAAPTCETFPFPAVPAVEADAAPPPETAGPPSIAAAASTDGIRKGDSVSRQAAAAAAAAGTAGGAADASAGTPSDTATTFLVITVPTTENIPIVVAPAVEATGTPPEAAAPSRAHVAIPTPCMRKADSAAGPAATATAAAAAAAAAAGAVTTTAAGATEASTGPPSDATPTLRLVKEPTFENFPIAVAQAVGAATTPPDAAAPPPAAAGPTSRMRKGDSAPRRAATAAAGAAAAPIAAAQTPASLSLGATAIPEVVNVPSFENIPIAVVPAVTAADTPPPEAAALPQTAATIPTPRIRKGDSAARRAAATAAAAAATTTAADASASSPSDAATPAVVKLPMFENFPSALVPAPEAAATPPPEAAALPPTEAAVRTPQMRKGNSAARRAAAAAAVTAAVTTAATDASANPPSDATATPVVAEVPTLGSFSIAAVPAVEAAATLSPPNAAAPPPTATVPTPRLRKSDSATRRVAAAAAAPAAAPAATTGTTTAAITGATTAGTTIVAATTTATTITTAAATTAAGAADASAGLLLDAAATPVAVKVSTFENVPIAVMPAVKVAATPHLEAAAPSATAAAVRTPRMKKGDSAARRAAAAAAAAATTAAVDASKGPPLDAATTAVAAEVPTFQIFPISVVPALEAAVTPREVTAPPPNPAAVPPPRIHKSDSASRREAAVAVEAAAARTAGIAETALSASQPSDAAATVVIPTFVNFPKTINDADGLLVAPRAVRAPSRTVAGPEVNPPSSSEDKCNIPRQARAHAEAPSILEMHPSPFSAVPAALLTSLTSSDVTVASSVSQACHGGGQLATTTPPTILFHPAACSPNTSAPPAVVPEQMGTPGAAEPVPPLLRKTRSTLGGQDVELGLAPSEMDGVAPLPKLASLKLTKQSSSSSSSQYSTHPASVSLSTPDPLSDDRPANLVPLHDESKSSTANIQTTSLRSENQCSSSIDVETAFGTPLTSYAEVAKLVFETSPTNPRKMAASSSIDNCRRNLDTTVQVTDESPPLLSRKITQQHAPGGLDSMQSVPERPLIDAGVDDHGTEPWVVKKASAEQGNSNQPSDSRDQTEMNQPPMFSSRRDTPAKQERRSLMSMKRMTPIKPILSAVGNLERLASFGSRESVATPGDYAQASSTVSSDDISQPRSVPSRSEPEEASARKPRIKFKRMTAITPADAELIQCPGEQLDRSSNSRGASVGLAFSSSTVRKASEEFLISPTTPENQEPFLFQRIKNSRNSSQDDRKTDITPRDSIDTTTDSIDSTSGYDAHDEKSDEKRKKKFGFKTGRIRRLLHRAPGSNSGRSQGSADPILDLDDSGVHSLSNRNFDREPASIDQLPGQNFGCSAADQACEEYGDTSSSLAHAESISLRAVSEKGDLGDCAHLEQCLQRAILGRSRLTEVLDAMYNVQGRVETQTTDSLFKFLSSPGIVEECMKILCSNSESVPAPTATWTSPEERDRRSFNPYHQVLVQAITSGPSTLRKSILSNTRARATLLGFFEKDVQTTCYEEKTRLLRIHSMARVIASLLHDSPSDMTECIVNRKCFISGLVRNHIWVSSVAEFVVELCAANPLTTPENVDEVRYGAANAAGIVLLVKEEIGSLLQNVYEGSGQDVGPDGPSAGRRRQTGEMCLFCVLELTKRTLVIPKYDKSNCSYSSRYIKQLNACLQQLSAFGEPRYVAGIMNHALTRLFGSPGDRGVALVAALDAISDLLGTVYKGSKSKLVSTRLTMTKQSTVALEEIAAQPLPTFIKLLDMSTERNESFQRLRLAIVELLRSLLMSKNERTLRNLAEYNVPGVLFSVLTKMEWSSIVQTKVTDCVALTFRGPREQMSPALHEPLQELQVLWLRAMSRAHPSLWEVLRAYRVLNLSQDGASGLQAREELTLVSKYLRPRGFFGIYIRIGLLLLEAARGERGEETLRAVMELGGVYGTFSQVRTEALEAIALFQQCSLGGPRPQKTTASLLASTRTLATLSLDNIDNIPMANNN